MNANDIIKKALHDLHSIPTEEYCDFSGHLSAAIMSLNDCVKEDLGEDSGIEIIYDEESLGMKIGAAVRQLSDTFTEANDELAFTKLDEMVWNAKQNEYIDLVEVGIEAELQFLCEEAYDNESLLSIIDCILDDCGIEVIDEDNNGN
jgi:aminoglycoside phosphotransferase